MENPTCQDCQHFHQHYVKSEKGYAMTGCGHCVHPRLKSRKTTTPACEKFSPRKSNT